MATKLEKAHTVIALLSVAENILVQAEGEGQNERRLLAATTKAITIIRDESQRQLRIYDQGRVKARG